MENLKELSCEELEQRRTNLAKFVFGGNRNLDRNTLSIYINKLTKVENELETRYQIIQEMISNPKDLEIIEYLDIANDTLENYNNIWQYMD